MKARVLVIDVTNQHTLESAVVEVTRLFGKLDMLVNNAGISLAAVPPSQCQIENLRKIFEPNFFANTYKNSCKVPIQWKLPCAPLKCCSRLYGTV